MDIGDVGNRIESARNASKSSLNDDLENEFGSLSDFEFDSLDLTDLFTDKDSVNDGASFGGLDTGGSSVLNTSNVSSGYSFGSFANNPTNGGVPNQQNAQTQNKEGQDWVDKLGDAFIASFSSSFKILKSILKSTKNRIADDWALFATNLLYNGLILAVVGISVWLISVIIGKPINFLRLPINSIITCGFSSGIAFLVLSGAANYVTRTSDKSSKLDIESISDSSDYIDTSSFYSSVTGSGGEDSLDEDDDDDFMSILNDLYNDEGSNATVAVLNSEEDSLYDEDDENSVFNSILKEATSKSDMSELVPAEVPIINRAYLVDLFKTYLMSSTPDFSKEEHIEAGDDRFKNAEATILSAYASASGKEVEEISNKVYLDSMVETLFSYEFKIKRANTVRIQEDKLREEMEAYFKSSNNDDTNPESGNVSASIVKDKDYFRVSVTKSNMKAIVSLGDCMQRSNVIEFFKDTSVHLPIIAGITDKGTPVLEDAKLYDATMIAGKQRSGKSWYVTSYVMQLQLFNTPEDVQFLYIDPKESFMFKSLSLMPHCCGLHNHTRILDILQDIIDLEAPRRKKLLQDNRCETVWDLRKKGLKLPILYIVIDEYMTIDGYLGDRVSTLQTQMREIMSQMPSLGVRLMFIPHRAQGVVDKTTRSLINYAAAVKTENSIVEETLDIKKWNRKLTMPGDIALRLGSRTLYVRGAALEKSDDDTIKFITQVAKSFYKMGVEMPDMSTIGFGYNRNEHRIREELEVSTGNRVQYDANTLSSELYMID